MGTQSITGWLVQTAAFQMPYDPSEIILFPPVFLSTFIGENFFSTLLFWPFPCVIHSKTSVLEGGFNAVFHFSPENGEKWKTRLKNRDFSLFFNADKLWKSTGENIGDSS